MVSRPPLRNLSRFLPLDLNCFNKRLPLIADILLVLFALSVATAWLYFEFGFSFAELLVSTSRMKLDSGQAYVAILPRPPLSAFVQIETESPRVPESSSTALYENGHRIGPTNSSPDHIRSIGRGAFLQMGRRLLFSTSDNSSPLTNQRTYQVRVSLGPTLAFRLVGLVASIMTLWRLFVLLPWRLQTAVTTMIHRVSRWLVTPVELSRNGFVSAMIAAAVIGASWYYLIGLWDSGKTVGFAAAGFFQVSDASGYAMCANQILDQNSAQGMVSYFGGWCLRRPIYPAFLATLLALTGRRWLYTLLLQSALVSGCIAALFRATARLAGPLTAFIVLWLMFSFSAQNAYPVTATENAGLALGAAGLALLLDATRLNAKRLLFLGAVCLSTGLNARAGAFLVAPCLVLAILTQSVSLRSRLLSAGIALVGIAFGFAAQLFLTVYLGGASIASHANFSYTLYGLSVGGKGWSQVFTDHPEIFRGNLSDAEVARRIFELAWKNITNSPTVIANALGRNLLDFFYDPLIAMAGSRRFPIWLWWLGALAIVLRWRELPYRVLGLMSLGVVLSSPVIIQDGGARLFAATWGVTAIQTGLGLGLLASGVLKLFDRRRLSIEFEQLRSHALDISFAVLLLTIIFLPLTPLRRLASIKPLSAQGCMNGEMELIARLGYESYMVALVDDNEPKSFWRMQVSAPDFRRGLKGAWFEKGFAELPVPTTVIHGYQLLGSQGPSSLEPDVRLVWYGDLGKLSGKTVSFCFRPDLTVPVTDATYYLARTVRTVNDE